jgi:hypothetical protein
MKNGIVIPDFHGKVERIRIKNKSAKKLVPTDFLLPWY